MIDNGLLESLNDNSIKSRKMSEVARIFAGGTPKTSKSEYYQDGDIPWICSGEVDFNSIYESQKYITSEGLNNSSAKMIKKESVLVALTGATAAKSAILEIDASANQSVCAIEPDPEILDYRFLYYVFESRYYEMRKMTQGAMTSINLNMIKNMVIDIPSLDVQKEVVRLIEELKIDKNEVQECLKKELSIREKQYKYYSHELFTVFSGKNIQKLGDIVDICMCKRIKKNQTSSVGEIPFYQNGTLGKTAKLYISRELFEEFSEKYRYPDVGDVMLSTVGTIGRTIQYDGEEAYYQDSNIVWFKRKEKTVLNEYLYWFCVSMPWKISDRATLNHLHNYMIVDTEISVPSIEEQHFIIEKFNELYSATEKLKKLIEREIDRREKQYEYYRDKLLTFKEVV